MQVSNPAYPLTGLLIVFSVVKALRIEPDNQCVWIVAEVADAQRRKVEDCAVWKDYHAGFEFPAYPLKYVGKFGICEL